MKRRAFPPVGRLVDAGGYRLHGDYVPGQSKHTRAMADVIRAMRATESELRRPRDYSDIPLIVLSEKWPLPETPDIEAAPIEDELQEEMLRFSRRGKHIRVESGHLIPLEKPEFIIDAVCTILGTLKHKWPMT